MEGLRGDVIPMKELTFEEERTLLEAYDYWAYEPNRTYGIPILCGESLLEKGLVTKQPFDLFYSSPQLRYELTGEGMRVAEVLSAKRLRESLSLQRLIARQRCFLSIAVAIPIGFFCWLWIQQTQSLAGYFLALLVVGYMLVSLLRYLITIVRCSEIE